jgi:hypothetical protein
MKIRNADLPPARRMEFRIGINLGDTLPRRSAFTVMASTLPHGSKAWLMQAVLYFRYGL